MKEGLSQSYQMFLGRWQKIVALNNVAGLMEWDQRVMMPSQGTQMRSQSMAALSEVIHELVIDERLWNILLELYFATGEKMLNEIERRNVQMAFHEVRRARCIPTELAFEIESQKGVAYEAWVKSRRDNDFSVFALELKKILKLVRCVAELYAGGSGDLYTALLQEYEPGYTADEIRGLFSSFREELVAVRTRVLSLPQPKRTFFGRQYSAKTLDVLGRNILETMGLNLGKNCRVDVTEHPFMGGTLDDIRIATRYTDGLESIYSIIHEGGHGLYEMGLPRQYANQPVGHYLSMGFHESQSRFWEVMVGKSQPFVEYLFPSFKRAFPRQLKGESAGGLYRALNAVKSEAIRVNSDPLTYDLHILLRFELEEKMINGLLEIDDLPQAWNEGFEKLFGFKPSSYKQGCGQDVHWSSGLFGYFPTYTLGNMRAAQILERMEDVYPTLWDDVAQGDFSGAREWLCQNIHQYGSVHAIQDLDRISTGRPLGYEALVRFLKKRYGDAYGVSL